MKIIFIAIMMISSLFASNIDWPSNYDEALKKAKQENKKVYLFITSDSCKWCREFEDTTLQNKEIMKKLNDNYVLLHLSKERHTIDDRFNHMTFVPKHFFLKADGEKIYEDYGYRTEEYFENLLDELEEEN